MSLATNQATGAYIYAFLPATCTEKLPAADLHGIDGMTITFVVEDNLAAAVSATEVKKIRPQRKYLAAHQEIVTFLARNFDTLPVAFGLIADDAAQVSRLLQSHQSVLHEQIERVSGHVEMAVNLRWSTSNVFQYFVERSPELQSARDAIAGGTASRDDQIAMGQFFERMLKAERDMHTDKFLTELEPICKEIDVQPAREEADILRAACLIPRDQESAFNDAVYRAAQNFSDEFAVSFNGPWPPYSFVKLALGLE